MLLVKLNVPSHPESKYIETEPTSPSADPIIIIIIIITIIIMIIIIMIMIMMMTMIIIMMIIIIALKGPNRDFLQSSHCFANCLLQHVRSSSQSAIVYVQMTCNTCAHHTIITKFEVEIAFTLALFLLAETINRRRRGGNQSTRRKPLTTSFRKCHILKPEKSSSNRDSNPYPLALVAG